MQDRIEDRDGRPFRVIALPDDLRLAASPRQRPFGGLRKQRKPSKKNALRAAIKRQQRDE